MAKRYKKDTKKHFWVYLICIVILVAIACVIFSFTRNNKSENQNNISQENLVENKEKNKEEKEENIVKDKNTNEKETEILDIDIFVPKVLESEIRSKIEDIKEAEVVKLHYQLKTIDEGIVEVYYKLDEKIYSANIDIASKQITKYKEIEDEELVDKTRIENNLEENVREDFEKYSDKLTDETGRLNIIISSTEIIINISYVNE